MIMKREEDEKEKERQVEKTIRSQRGNRKIMMVMIT